MLNVLSELLAIETKARQSAKSVPPDANYIQNESTRLVALAEQEGEARVASAKRQNTEETEKRLEQIAKEYQHKINILEAEFFTNRKELVASVVQEILYGSKLECTAV
jgi:F0F1-type ATP synthase membrane subunit b/b'